MLLKVCHEGCVTHWLHATDVYSRAISCYFWLYMPLSGSHSFISVIIPTYNRIDKLERVLPSYLSQRHVGEVIVVDDASSDGTRDFFLPILITWFGMSDTTITKDCQQPGTMVWQ